MGAYFKATLGKLAKIPRDEVMGALGRGIARDGFFASISAQTDTWEKEITLLKSTAVKIQKEHPSSSEWHVLLEYPLLRVEKRIDTVLLADDLIFGIEFKVGGRSFDLVSMRQVEDYALSLRDFHHESRHRTIVPILCATKAESGSEVWKEKEGCVLGVHCANAASLADVILRAYKINHKTESDRIDADEWNKSAYRPVPNIVEAAQMLYSGHTVRDISRASASIYNLTRTTDRVIQIIEYAERHKKRAICFVTGVPGSGKTLTGLNAVHDPKFQKGDRSAGTFLSGNRPLVEVVREALVRSYRAQYGMRRHEGERKAKTQIQHIINYLRQYTREEPDRAPYENAIVFDEAQRAWDAAHGEKKFGREASEPELFLRIMERHKDWAVIIAVVGGGQEINSGEAGLQEWGKALTRHTGNKWEVFVSPEALYGGNSIAGSLLFEEKMPKELTINEDGALHLPVSVRSFRSEDVAGWVNYVLKGETSLARETYNKLKEYPIVMTRDLYKAKSWLREQVRGNRRCGLVASSSAKRLRAYGLQVHGAQDMNEIKHWFLDPDGDVRSSNMLEVATSEFACQGLELDFVGVCWGGDFTRKKANNGWDLRRFRGNRWQNVTKDIDRDFLVNKYRVLLTRAREGMVIWIPEGDNKDTTRKTKPWEATAGYLLKCGIIGLD